MKKAAGILILMILLSNLCLSCPALAETTDSSESKALEYFAHELEA